MSRFSISLRVVSWTLAATCMVPAVAHAQEAEAGAPSTPAAEASAPATPGGTLQINADGPGGDVLLDGQLVGTLPFRKEGISPGPHQVQVVRPPADPWSRTVEIQAGSVTQVELATPVAPMAPLVAEPSTSEAGSKAGEAWKDFGLSILQMPWAGLAVGVTFSLLLGSVVFFTTNPSDAPFLENNDINVSDMQWRAAGVTALVAGVLSSGVALALLLLSTEPVSRFVSALRTSTGN